MGKCSILLMPNVSNMLPPHSLCPPPNKLQKKINKTGRFQHTLIQSILSTNLAASFSGYTETTSRRQYMTGKPEKELKNQVIYKNKTILNKKL